jgi:hypothetical protein
MLDVRVSCTSWRDENEERRDGNAAAEILERRKSFEVKAANCCKLFFLMLKGRTYLNSPFTFSIPTDQLLYLPTIPA